MKLLTLTLLPKGQVGSFGLIFLFTLFLYSCSGGKVDDPAAESDSEYYVKFKQDGKEQIITDLPRQGYIICSLQGGRTVTENGKPYYIFSLGSYAVNIAYPQMKLRVYSSNTITNKEYKSDNPQSTDPVLKIEATLPVADVQKKQDGFHAENGISIIITEISRDFVKGKFSGKLFSYTDNSSVMVTDGEFFAKRDD